MEATSPTNTGVNMRRGITALGAFAAVTALAACSGNTTPAATDNDTAVTLTIWADDTRFTQVQTFAEDFTNCLLYTSPSPRDPKTSRMPSSA